MFLAGVCACAAAAGLAAGRPARFTTKPNRTFLSRAAAQANATSLKNGATNIILMIADDIGFTDMGYFGYDLAGTTPIMDQLASEGIKYSNWYVQRNRGGGRGRAAQRQKAANGGPGAD